MSKQYEIHKELYQQFKDEHPETIGEKDSHFDLSNYCDWLELKYSKLQSPHPPKSAEEVSDSEIEGMADKYFAEKYDARILEFIEPREMFIDGLNQGLQYATQPKGEEEDSKRKCPKCGSSKIIMFTSDLDMCENCNTQLEGE